MILQQYTFIEARRYSYALGEGGTQEQPSCGILFANVPERCSLRRNAACSVEQGVMGRRQAIPGEKAIHQGNQMLSGGQRDKLAALTGADK
jgi:hypothetical protein